MNRNVVARAVFLTLILLRWAQDPAKTQERRHLQRDASFPEPFGLVGGIRPLSDGRIMVADPLGQLLVLADMDTGIAETLGGVGQGPQEYKAPDAVFPLPGDTTLLVDLGNGRTTEVAPDGTFGRTSPLAQQSSDGRLTIVLPRFVDGAGNVYFEPEEITGGPVADSVSVIRFDRGEMVWEVVCAVGLPEAADQRRRGRFMLGRRPLAPSDDWAVAEDGSVAVVRADGYVVEWISTDGSRVSGPPNPVQPERIERADREAWFEEFLTGEISTGIRRSADGTRNVTFTRGTSSRTPDDLDAYDWPQRLPSFRARRSLVSPEEELWVERYVPAGAPAVVDLFDRAGKKTGEVELPLGRRVVGFGPGVVYLVHTDEFGLEWLERYRR